MADRPFPAERTSLSFLLLSISFFLLQVTAFLVRIPSHRSAPGAQAGMIFYRSLTFSRRAQGRMPGPPEEKQEGRHRPQTIPDVKKQKTIRKVQLFGTLLVGKVLLCITVLCPASSGPPGSPRKRLPAWQGADRRSDGCSPGPSSDDPLQPRRPGLCRSPL